ncbi:MAG TPA: choice-of-anchor L domain-containing protein, partial [Bacteroidales bacterium]|nr:choice-of-anchor L domain-containing protein [Bacteroidales bacterium]
MRTSLRFIAVCRMMAITIPLILICSLSVIGQDYPDGPYRPDPNGNRPQQDQIDISHIGGGGSRAGTGSIAVNENPTYNAYTPAQLVQNILVKGCLVASDVTFSGLFNASNANQRQLGYFNKAEATSFPLDEGLILSSGYVVTAEGPNSSGSAGTDLGGAGDSDLNALSGYTTHDAAVLEFDFIPAGNTLEFQFIFASEEYLEFCCTQYNDVFGFFLSGTDIPGGTVNLAVLPGTTTPITVNQIHSYVADNYYHNSCTAANASYYINNPSGSSITQYDGYTVTLTATHAVTACSTYHIKMAIADASDHIYDSGVFLKGQSFSSEPVAFLNEVQPYGSSSFTASDNIFEGCTPNHLRISRTSSTQDVTVYLQYSGTAINGSDVQLVGGGSLPSSVLIPAGSLEHIINYYAVDDGAGDNGETFTVSAKISCPCETPPSYVIKNLHIHEAIVSVEAIPTNVVCNAVTNGTIIVNVTGGSGTFQYSLDGTTWQSGNLFTGLAMGTYTVYVRDVSSCTAPTVVAGVVIGAAEAIDANAGPDKTICSGQSTTLNGSGGVLYSWSPSTGLSATNIPNPVASPATTTTYTLTVTSSTGQCPDNDQVVVTVLPSPTAAITPLNSTICLGGSVTLTASGGGAYLWNPGGSTAPSITVSPTTNASYTVLVTSPNGCTDTEAASVYVNPAPASFNVTGGGAICGGGSVHVGLSGSVTGTNYQLFKDGSPLGSPVNGTGSALDFGPYSLAGTYTVGATISATSCTATMSGSAVITVDPTSVGGTATPSQTICSGSSPADITLTGNAGNIQWQSSSDNVTFYDIAGATSASLTSAQMGTLTSTTYYHAEVTSGVCSPAYSNTVTVTVIQPPVAPANASVDRNNF